LGAADIDICPPLESIGKLLLINYVKKLHSDVIIGYAEITNSHEF